jgi:hypothetical protein
VHILEEWRIRDQIESATRGKVDDYEFHSLKSDVASLERTVRELSSAFDGVRFELQQLQESLNERQQTENFSNRH